MVEFDEELLNTEAPEENIKKIKIWLFQEQVRIQAQNDELQDMKRAIDREKSILEIREKNLKKRYDDNELFIAKKKKIIEDAYQQLALDRKALECERLNFEHEKGKYRRQKMSDMRSNNANTYQYEAGALDGTSFFRGVDNELALRKRYKELLKIFHPDNKCGDTKTLIRIQAEYESIKKRYYEA